MGEMTELTLEEHERQWLREHPGCTEKDYLTDHESAAERESDLQMSLREKRVEEIESAVARILKALNDGGWWITKSGDRLLLKDISPRHARNIIGWLRRRATLLHDIACLELAALPEPNGEQARYMAEEEFDRFNSMNPVEWLMKTPLVVNLKDKIRVAEKVD